LVSPFTSRARVYASALFFFLSFNLSNNNIDNANSHDYRLSRHLSSTPQDYGIVGSAWLNSDKTSLTSSASLVTIASSHVLTLEQWTNPSVLVEGAGEEEVEVEVTVDKKEVGVEELDVEASARLPKPKQPVLLARLLLPLFSSFSNGSTLGRMALTCLITSIKASKREQMQKRKTLKSWTHCSISWRPDGNLSRKNESLSHLSHRSRRVSLWTKRAISLML
jgi:hypothetical protein